MAPRASLYICSNIHPLTAGPYKDKAVLKTFADFCLLFPPALHLLGTQWNGTSWSPVVAGAIWLISSQWPELRSDMWLFWAAPFNCRCETFLNVLFPLPLASGNTGIGGCCVSLDPGVKRFGEQCLLPPLSDLWCTGNVSEKQLCCNQLLRF